MSANNLDVIRSAVLGADRAFPLPDDRGDRKPPFPDRPREDVPPCPITPLGDRAGTCYFLDNVGQERHITARGFGNRSEVRGLFRGDETWLRQCWPEYGKATKGNGEASVIGFVVDWAAAWLQRFCCAQGLYNENLKFRKPGIWRGEGNQPIVHCGNVVLINGVWHNAGVRTGSQFWVAGSPTARPGLPCDASVGREFAERIQGLWKFERAGAPQLLLGFIPCGLLGTSLWSRPNLMFTGLASSGKTALARTLQAACPMNAFSDDATESGIMGEVAGRVMPIFLDEAFDRLDQQTAVKLIDMILGMSSGDGARKTRGTADGGYRTTEMAGCVLFSSVNPPPMKQTHLGRVTMIEMLRPGESEDYDAQHRAMIEWARLKGPSLWGRVISSAERFHASLPIFRDALAKAGCAPREMNQLGALLAGWWIMTEQGVADETAGRKGVGLATDFVRTAADIELDSAPRNAVRHLVSRLLQFDGSTRRELVSVLLERAWRPEDTELDHEKSQDVADATLKRYGLRAVRPCLSMYHWGTPQRGDDDYFEERGRWMEESWRLRADAAPPPADDPCQKECCFNRRVRKYIPRLGLGAGVWVAAGAAAPLFKDAPELEGQRWKTELLRLGRMSSGTVRIGASERAIWLPREEVDDGGG
jgi:hypothetical protein